MREGVLYDMTNEEMLEMRMNGATYQEIADICGISKQRVHQKIGEYSPRVKAIRRGSVYLEEIKYKGIYEFFKENLDVAFCGFVKGILGDISHCATEKMRRFLRGENEVKFSIPQIKKMCEVCGKPFEEVFKERKSEDEVVTAKSAINALHEAAKDFEIDEATAFRLQCGVTQNL